MNIKIVCAGKLKDRSYIELAEEYAKRLGRYCTLTVCEVADEKTPERFSPAERQQAIGREGERLLARIESGEHVIALCVNGRRMTSEAFAARLQALADGGRNAIAFVIGGSLGLSDAVLARADEALSVSAMTLPHRLCRVLLMEQIYRAHRINAPETDHK